jgi:hypothetical protein
MEKAARLFQEVEVDFDIEIVCGDIIKQYHYDKEQGDNGKRIEQCKKWACK